MPNPIKNLVKNLSSATARVAPELLKALVILSDTTVGRSAVDQEDLKTYWKAEKKNTFLLGDQQFYYNFFKDFTSNRKKTNRVLVFSCRPFPSILQYRNHQ